MSFRLLIEVIDQTWSILEHGLHLWILAVQDPQGIGVKTALTVGVQMRLVDSEIVNQQRPVARLYLSRAERVDLESQIGQAK